MKRLALLTLLALPLAATACGANTAAGHDSKDLAASIKPDLQKQLQEQYAQIDEHAKVRVKSVDCVIEADHNGRCFAKVTTDGEPGNLSIRVTTGDDGLIWEVEL